MKFHWKIGGEIILMILWACSFQFQSACGEICPQGPYFIVSLCESSDGTLWAGTDGDGLWMSNATTSAWVRDRSYEIVGGMCAYAIYEDNNKRLWAGTLHNGVCVKEGDEWKRYSIAEGFRGSRVFSITGSSNGLVFIASDGGLAVYSSSTDTWHFFSRADGLVENEIHSLACDKSNVYLGYATCGIGICDYNTGAWNFKCVSSEWRFGKENEEYPLSQYGRGIPSNLVNCIFASHGMVFAGTIAGMAVSKDKGRNWNFSRSAEFNRYLSSDCKGIKSGKAPSLRDDYVVAFCSLGKNRDLVFSREGGAMIYDSDLGRLASVPDNVKVLKWTTTAIRTRDGKIVVGTYGNGVVELPMSGEEVGMTKNAGPVTKISLPSKKLKVKLARHMMQEPGLPVFYLHDDWRTKGDWWRRYGIRKSVLCAACAPWGDCEGGSSDDEYNVFGTIGANNHDDGLRRWVHWIDTDNENSLWLMSEANRRQSEWDDHGETYNRYFNGPDLMVKISVPNGAHDVALYFFNKDGREGQNRRRDYLIEISRYDDSFRMTSQTNGHTYFRVPTLVLARARVKDFYNGVYKIFRVVEGGEYLVRIRRQGSYATILSGVFVQASRECPESQDVPYVDTVKCMGGVVYSCPSKCLAGEPFASEGSQVQMEIDDYDLARTARAYDRARANLMAMLPEDKSEELGDYAECVRWRIKHWTDDDRHRYHQYMMLGWTAHQIRYPLHRLNSIKPRSKNTTDGIALEKRDWQNIGLTWYDKVPADRREWVEEPTSNFFKSVVSAHPVFRPKAVLNGKRFKKGGVR